MATAAQAPQTATNTETVTQSVLDRTIEETLRKQTLSWKVTETGENLELSIAHVRKLFANPTKSGSMPSDKDCWLFLHLCKAKGLNPYVGDAFLVGFDQDGDAKFSLITAHQALLKRAEASGQKRGMESGVIVIDNVTGEERERHGDFFRDDCEKLVGGWAKVYRADWDHPAYERVSLKTFNKGWGRWRLDPGGMIVKVAEASAHRLAFPRETGGLYVKEEMGTFETHASIEPQEQPKRSKVEEMAARYKKSEPAEEAVDPEPPEPEVEKTSEEVSDENEHDIITAAVPNVQSDEDLANLRVLILRYQEEGKLTAGAVARIESSIMLYAKAKSLKAAKKN